MPAASGWGIARWTHFHRASPDNNTKVPGLATMRVGFSLAAIVSNYPSVLIGYGAAPILGYGLALALAQHTRRD